MANIHLLIASLLLRVSPYACLNEGLHLFPLEFWVGVEIAVVFSGVVWSGVAYVSIFQGLISMRSFLVGDWVQTQGANSGIC